MEVIDYLIDKKGWKEDDAIAYVKKMMKFPWGKQ